MFTQENVFENVVCEMLAILFPPRCAELGFASKSLHMTNWKHAMCFGESILAVIVLPQFVN